MFLLQGKDPKLMPGAWWHSDGCYKKQKLLKESQASSCPSCPFTDVMGMQIPGFSFLPLVLSKILMSKWIRT